jgi:hypothetical protein
MTSAPSSPAEAGRGALAELGSLAIVEVNDARALAGTLFERNFKTAIPDFPRHFVLVDRGRGEPGTVIGYVHHTPFGEAYLAGGLVVAALEFRRLDERTAAAVRGEGGLGEWIMRASCASLDGDAVFAYMGDAKSIRVNLRVGFVPTAHRYLHVLWKRALPPERMRAIVERVAALGAF